MSDKEAGGQRSSAPKINNTAWFFIIGLAEAMGTALLVLIGCTGAIPSIIDAPSHLQICIVFGMAVTMMVQIFGHVSGAHINPAVTLAALIFKMISLPTAGLYMLSQFVGGIFGYGVLLILVPTEALYKDTPNYNVTHGFCTTVPSEKVAAWQALMSEFISTAILIYICCSVWDKRNATKHDSVPLKFGVTIAGLATAFGPISGGSMNPARTFAPAVFTGVWDKHWVYWVGPFAAALSTAYFYNYTFNRNHGANESDQSDVPLNQINSKVQNIEKLSSEDIATL